MQQNEYHDYKWEIIVNRKRGVKVYCQCECGFKHDISLDKDLDFIGRGTYLKEKKEK